MEPRNEPHQAHAAWSHIAAELREPVDSALRPGEEPRCWLALNLDVHLRFSSSLLILTGQRLIQSEAGRGNVREWDITNNAALNWVDDGGTWRLELLVDGQRQAVWRRTPSGSDAIVQFLTAFEVLQATRAVERSGGHTAPTSGSGGSDEGASDDFNGAPADETAASERPARSMWRLVRFARPWSGMILLGLVLSLASTAASLAPPLLTMPLLDDVLIPYQQDKVSRLHLVKWYLLALAGAAVLTWGLTWARTWVLAWVTERIAGELRNRTYSHLQTLSLEYFGGRRTGDLISRVSTDTDRICYFLSVNLIDFTSDVMLIVLSAIIMITIDLPLAIVTLAPIPVIAWLVQSVRNRLRIRFHLSSRAWSGMTSVLADTIPGIRVVKAFAQESREVERFRSANDGVLRANDRVNSLWSLFGAVVVLLTDIGLVVVWAFGAWGVTQGRLTVGVLTAFIACISRFYLRLDSMSRMAAAVQRAAASAHRIFDILDRVPSVAEVANPIPIPRLKGGIDLVDVQFRYGSRQILKGITLQIQPGEMIGLVGPSGGGKTTIINMVCRFYDPTDGTVLVDGLDLRKLSLRDYRRQIGLVLQEPFLFYGTVAENIAYGRPEATREEIIAAARAARAHEFILRLPDAYDSLVGERGQSLSGGERQRISIARALLVDPRILILDEATSSVDTETEREIQLALENLTRGRTTIAIAHRLSTLHRADRLVVIDQGRIAQVGTHDDLVHVPGIYSRLYHAQAREEARREVMGSQTTDDFGESTAEDGESYVAPASSRMD